MTENDAATEPTESAPTDEIDALRSGLLAGDHRALARTISKIEDRAPGYRRLVGSLFDHTGTADVIGVTGSPGAGKSTLVDKLAETYRDRGETVGIIAIDPSSPFSGGAVLGDRIRMASTVGDMDVFVRSMSARGTLGGLSTATADAVKAMDAFGKDKIIIETVGAGQNEIDIVRTADTVAVLVPPGSGDAVQTLKAGILEIADVFVVNKADRDGADRTVQELLEMIELGDGPSFSVDPGHHGPGSVETSDDGDAEPSEWRPPIVETIATDGVGVDELIDEFAAHADHLRDTGEGDKRTRRRHAEEIRTLLREDLHGLLEDELDRVGGIDELASAVAGGRTDPYTIAGELLEPVETCLGQLDESPTIE
ncbi:methylmalonyl Co-A mutase-associated GTPase MeaB [Halovivax gelatinilyticus]|uniref:methylmalonyl Co-A mutase-associated GTPase MeaB n=1 Tax=Halovivax gelatinilyticus TaxID=2961597 RepID=UPI0020CA2EC5|nr:methylmalonyl Co-A mutase-associated GTPase MeaB [Halovivax gelatinilyticus]